MSEEEARDRVEEYMSDVYRHLGILGVSYTPPAGPHAPPEHPTDDGDPVPFTVEG